MTIRPSVFLNFVLFATALAHLSHAAQSEENSIGNIFQYSEMKSFLEDQKQRAQKAMEMASNMKSTFDSYMEEQQNKISAEFNNYITNVKESGMKMVNKFSFMPTEDPSSRMKTPDAVLTVPAIIAKNGYVCETHTIVSQGYILNLHRIPSPKGGRQVSTKTVLLQHGIFASSADWVLNGPEKGLAYVLADAGYDVWMSNIRGNRYSKEHSWLKTDSKDYWNFSWHEVAMHDIPAIIDYIRNLKGYQTKISYIGHSMGTAILFAMLTLRPEYNEKLSAGIALAPVTFMSDIKSPMKLLAPIASNLAYTDMLGGSYEFIPKKSTLGKMTSSCSVDGMDFYVCKNVIFQIVGQNENQLNKTLLPVFLSHLGTGTSWKTALHFAQEVEAGGRFQQFDYGPNGNLRMYGTLSPPEYDLSKVTCPIKLYWSENDLLSSEADVMKLYKRLNPETTELYKVPDPAFNHLDYLWAVDAPRLVNDKILMSLVEVFQDDRK